MKKIVIGLLILAVLAAAYWLGAPLFLDKEVDESIEEIMKSLPPLVGESGETPEIQAQVVARGSFRDADSFHEARGTVSLIKTRNKYFVRFESDFETTNGPDLFVHFGKDGAYVGEARLGVLKGNIGGQNYEVPANLNPGDYNEVWIWCRAFSVPFGSAQLEPASGEVPELIM